MNAVVLLAEDEPVSRAFLIEALAALGVDCEAVDDGDAAWRRACERRFDALLLDLNLPARDGVRILADVRGAAQARSRSAPALALTADDTAETRSMLLAAGFAAVACKPIALDVLATALARIGLAVGARDDAAPLWDESHALSAVGGNRTIADTLRQMLLKELPRQRDVIVAAVARGDADAARGELHRLQAACGFCGAARLLREVKALHAALGGNGAGAADPGGFVRCADEVLADVR